MEHGPVSYENLQNLIRGALLAGILPIVRTSDAMEISIGRALDLGAMGVQVPQVRTAEQARSVVSAARFHPAGERGVCRFVRAADYSSLPAEQYFEQAGQVLVVIQLEGTEAIKNIDGILEVDGIDIIFIGPYDLSQSMGLPGRTDHPDVIRAMRKIVDKAAAKGRTVGTFTETPGVARKWKDAGVQYLSYSVDVGIFTSACRDLVSNLSKL
jgi:4-hydroxy-2-oxoheptanedioate aldolase